MSMNTRLLLITFLCVFSIGQCIAQTWYTGKDNFRQAIFQDSILSDYNYQAEKDIVNVTEPIYTREKGFVLLYRWTLPIEIIGKTKNIRYIGKTKQGQSQKPDM